MRGIRTAYTNVIHTTPKGLGATFSDGLSASHESHSPANSPFFKKFMKGSHERMGDVVIQDKALTIDVLLALQELLEERWQEHIHNADDGELFEVATAGAATVCGFSSGLRGEELAHIRLRETILLAARGLMHPRHPHVVLAMEGRFKGRVARKKHKIPLVPTTDSGLDNQEWLLRLLDCYFRVGTDAGPLFRRNVRSVEPAQISELDALFHDFLGQLRDRKPELFDPDEDVTLDYSVRRSLRRGATAQARNVKVPEDVIKINNRWRTEDAARQRHVSGGDMMEHYTDVLAALETLLQFSGPL